MAGLHALLSLYLDSVEEAAARPVTLRFRPPLPPSITNRYKLSATPQIKQVILAGHFSDWNPHDTNFRMKPAPDGSWTYAMRFYPGRNPYKFVIHVRNPALLPATATGMIWSHDPTATEFEDDTYRGKNSVYTIRNVSEIRTITRHAFLIIFFGIILLFVLELAVSVLMTRRLSLKHKLLAVFLILFLIANLFFILVLRRQNIRLFQTSMIDRINFLHGYFRSRGIRMETMQQEPQRDKLRQALAALFDHLGSRFEYHLFSNTKQQVDNLFVLDEQGGIIARGMVENARKYVLSIYKTEEAVDSYYRNTIRTIFARLGPQLLRERRLFSLNWYDFQAAAPASGNYSLTPPSGYFHLDTFVYPVYAHDRLLGFYLLRINARSLAALLKDFLLFNVFLGAVLCLVFFMIIRKLGNVILEPVFVLKTGMTRIMEGDYDYAIAFKSNDELYQLGVAYNYMRLGLIEANVLRNKLLQNAAQEARQLADIIARREVVQQEVDQSRIVYRSEAMHAVIRRVKEAASRQQPVLITGETGTGKELIARLLHNGSTRATHPFVGLNCSAIPSQLWEDEIFGHLKGAFTDAKTTRKGKLEEAGEGILFFDEIGEMPPDMQAKLLRVLQEREYYKIGSSVPERLNCRFLFATNRNLEEMTADGRFRQDLFYRINVFHIHLPPLRERKEDIPDLVNYLVSRFADEMGVRITQLEEQALHRLQEYPWPGNIRELENAIIRGLASCAGRDDDSRQVLKATDLSLGPPDRTLRQGSTSGPDPDGPGAHAVGSADFQTLVNGYMRQLIIAAIREAEGNRSRAARMLGLKRGALLYRMKELGIE